MRIYVVIPGYGHEGYGDPIYIGTDYEAARNHAEHLEKAED
jgi:hypothetical protein